MQILGDILPGAVLPLLIATTNADRALADWTGGASLLVQRDDGTRSSAGITLTVNASGRTGLHPVLLTTGADAGFYTFGRSYWLVGNGGVVDTVPVLNMPVAHFTMGQGIDLADSGVPQAVALNATTIRDAANFGPNALTGRTLHMWGSDQQYWVSAPITGNTGDVLAHGPFQGNIVPSGSRIYAITNASGGTASVDLSGVTSQLTTLTTRLGVPVGASISADVASVKADTAAIVPKTNALTFSLAGQVDANTRFMNGAQLIGNGTPGNRFRGA